MDKIENLLLSYWNGKQKLWKAFWIVGVLGRILIATFIIFFTLLGQSLGLTWSILILSFVFILIYIIWSFVSIWQCSFNVKNKIWGHLARIFVSMDLFTGIYQAINIINNQSLSGPTFPLN